MTNSTILQALICDLTEQGFNCYGHDTERDYIIIKCFNTMATLRLQDNLTLVIHAAHGDGWTIDLTEPKSMDRVMEQLRRYKEWAMMHSTRLLKTV